MKWTKEEIDIIENNWEIMSDEEMTSLLSGRSKCAIECKRKKLGFIRPQYKIHTFKEVLDEFAKREFLTLLSDESEYNDCHSKMRYLCKKHKDKGEQTTTLGHLLEGKGCIYCGIDRMVQSHLVPLDKEHDKELCKSKDFQYIDTVRKDGVINIAFICNKHSDLGIQYMTKYNMERTNLKGCKYCSGKDLPEWYVLKKAKEINPDIEILEPYTNLTTHMNCHCKKHDYPTIKTMRQILKGKGCYYCGCEKLSNQSYLSKDFVQSEISKINPHVKIIEYKGAAQQSKCYCTKHNKYFQKGYYALIHNKNSGCEICYAENLRASQGMGIDEFKKRLKEVHPELIVTGEYINNCTPIEIYCTTHDYTFSSKPVDILKRINCCDKSRKTYKEEYICSFIEETYGFSITRQKKFDDCKDKNYLPFDIYLDDYNVLIEYQGEQHYKPIRYSGESWEEAEEKFEYTKKHDLIKKEYCTANNIPLLEIPYWEFDDLEYYLFDSFTELKILEEI